jgi:hypothetical protein
MQDGVDASLDEFAVHGLRAASVVAELNPERTLRVNAPV